MFDFINSVASGLVKKVISKHHSDEFEVHFNKIPITRKWNNRITFIIYTIGYTLGYGHLWKFPCVVYKNGNGTFLILYTFACLCFGAPLLILELGIGQYSSGGCTNAFNLVPLFFGIGWSMIFLSTFIMVFLSVIMSWAYFYLFLSLSSDPPWSLCQNNFNSFSCTSSYIGRSYENETGVPSTDEYFRYHVVGSRMHINDSIFPTDDSSGIPTSLFLVILVCVHFIPILINVLGRGISETLLHFTVVYPYFVLFIIMLRTMNQEGGYNGIIYYLTPKWKYFKDFNIYFEVLQQLFFSSGLGTGVLITLSGYNYFGEKLFKDAIIIVAVNYVTSLFFGFVVFSCLGYYSEITSISIENLVKHDWQMIFEAYPVVFAQLYGEPFWNLVFMFIFICVGFDAQLGFLETFTTAIIESSNIFQKIIPNKIYLELGISFLLFIFSLFMLIPGGVYLIYTWTKRMFDISLPLLIFLEISVVVWIYNHDLLIKNYKMMMGVSLSRFWIIMIGFVLPPAIIITLILHIRFQAYCVLLPVWAEVINVALVLLIFLPTALGMVYTILTYMRQYSNLSIMELVKKTLYSNPDNNDRLLSLRYKKKFHQKYREQNNEDIFKHALKEILSDML